ncbi:MAG: hypothetical protein EAZ09_17000 [Oscillatoriales cyanobacterium]|nr:MAG: hypothetical protein EAZ18_16300 [Oscillatoriales cyanobacterium]TAH19061.1 MAG: hypothetical protein EAZ09_17000 [Oscillatoriales cyanobacterium]
MWRVTINCPAASWDLYSKTFKAIAEKYPGTPLSSKKMKGDGQRIMEYQIENVNDAEDFMEECSTLDGFIATFESL